MLGGFYFTNESCQQLAAATERAAQTQATPLQIVDVSENVHPLAIGWWSVPGGDLVELSLTQHPALAQTGQRFRAAVPGSGSTWSPRTAPRPPPRCP